MFLALSITPTIEAAVTADNSPGGASSALLLADGSSGLLLADGSSFLLLTA